MKIDKNTNFLIVGLGLLGGSYAKALKAGGYRVAAVTRSQSSIDYAMENGIIDAGSAFVDAELIGKADVVVLAMYPHVLIKWVEENQQYFKSGALITDVTGVKGCVVGRVQEMLRGDVEFIAAHPMAGREVPGVQNADAGIFRVANYIVTPTEKNSPEAIESCEELGRILGFARVSRLSVAEHDRMIGFVSQLTHCIAVTLMTCNDKEHMEKYTGDSFRDLTRIARINDLMWSELFVANKDVLLNQMDMFIREFGRLRDMIETEDIDGMRAMMRHSTARRALFDKK